MNWVNHWKSRKSFEVESFEGNLRRKAFSSLVDCKSKLNAISFFRDALGTEAATARLEASSVGCAPHFHRPVAAFHEPVLPFCDREASARKVYWEASLRTVTRRETVSCLCKFDWSALRRGEGHVACRHFERFRIEAQFAKNKAR